MSTYGFQQFGDWEKFNNLSKSIAPDLRRSAMKGQGKAVRRIATIVKNHLRNQDLGWKPLSTSYRYHKKENKDMILVHTWKYYEAIKIEKVGNIYAVGVRKNIYYTGSDGKRVQVYVAAIMNEQGYSDLFGRGITLPKRPLWKPSMKEFNAEGGIAEIIITQLRVDLYKRGWRKTIVKKLKEFKAPIK